MQKIKHTFTYIVFRKRVIDKWNNLPRTCCTNCTTLNNFKSHNHKVYWNRKPSKKVIINLDSERKPMFAYCVSLINDGFGEFGEYCPLH